MLRLVALGCALLAVAGCREEVPLDMGLDMAQLDCSTVADCLACCSAEYSSGALDFDSELQSCVCPSSPCAGACGETVCGATVGIDAPCRACLLGDGGVCEATIGQCLANAGPCGAWKDCVDRCR